MQKSLLSCLFIAFYRAFYSTYEIFPIIIFYLCLREFVLQIQTTGVSRN